LRKRMTVARFEARVEAMAYSKAGVKAAIHDSPIISTKITTLKL
jgi:hypothetical protein